MTAYPHRMRFTVGAGDQVAHVEAVRVGAGELPFVALLDDTSGLFVSPQLTRLRDVVRVWGAMRDLSLHHRLATVHAMLEAIAALDPVFASVARPVLDWPEPR